MNSNAPRVRPTDPASPPWEHEHPKDAHVLVETENKEWVQGFLFGDAQAAHRVGVLGRVARRFNLREEWVSQTRVRPREG